MAKQNLTVSDPWLTDQKDPDNFLVIPDFGVNPVDASFEGFAFPIVTPSSNELRERHENIRELVKLIRAKIRKQFNSLADVRTAHLRVLDVLYPQDGSLSNENDVEHLSHQDKCASFYVFTMQSLDSATRDHVYTGLSKSAGNAALSLSRAALWIAQWTNSDVGSLSQSLREAAEASSDRARKAADARHNKPGGSREKQDAIRAAWATGKYTSRDMCAEQECAALAMSFSTARKALRNTPNPS